MATNGWNNCPADILYLILKEVSTPEHRTLCLVSKAFHSFTEPLLYSAIGLTFDREDPDRLPPFILLLRTLLTRPHLAAYITALRLNGNTCLFNWNKYRWTLPKVPVSDDFLDEPIAFVQGAKVPYSHFWIHELSQGSIDAWVALLLAQLPNLKSLYIAHVFARQSTLVGMVLRSAILEPRSQHLPDFRRLQHVSFIRLQGRDEACSRTARNTLNLLPLLYLPCGQRMTLAIQNPKEWIWPAAALSPPRPSKLTSLDLRIIREGCLGEVLAVTPNLQSLHWEWYYDEDVQDWIVKQTVDLDKIAAELSLVQGSLTHLTITAEIGSGVLRPAIKTRGSLHAMVSFDMLKTLHIPWAFLVGFAQDPTKRLQDSIPRNIERLTLTDDLALQNDDEVEPDWPCWEWEDHVMVDLIQAWLVEWRTCTPCLRGVSLILSYIDTDRGQWLPEMRDRLVGLGSEAGVRVELVEVG
ncbi:hypothetical protein BJY04DRAFT_221599 [Aspergillus karnatakaensis]|uniref:uncharacterized protein n=1 Tax=Aspergillus karnatakaensis TaxID=1810916 RepID=UPI003CCD6CC3